MLAIFSTSRRTIVRLRVEENVILHHSPKHFTPQPWLCEIGEKAQERNNKGLKTLIVL